MLLSTILPTLNAFISEEHNEKFSESDFSTKIIAKNYKNKSLNRNYRKVKNSTRKPILFKRLINMNRKLKMIKYFGHYEHRIIFLGFLVCVGLYSAKIGASSIGHIDPDFSILKNVLEASQTSDCKKNFNPEAIERSRRIRREIASSEPKSDAPLGMPSCLDQTDPTYYVSKYHRKVCKATVTLVYQVFFERNATESEFKDWFEKCVSREVNEAYLLWKFAEDEEHIEMLKEKKRQKMEKEVEESMKTGAIEENPQNETEPIKNSEEDPLAVPMKMRMPEEEYSEELNDPESEEFKKKSDEYGEALADALKDDVPGLTGVKVLGFSNGSLVVYYELIFEDGVKNVSMLYEGDGTDPPKPGEPFDQEKFAKNVKTKVKGVIKEAISNPEKRDGKSDNPILTKTNVDLDSLDTISDDVVHDLVKLNPDAPIVKVDPITHEDEGNGDGSGSGSETNKDEQPSTNENSEVENPDEGEDKDAEPANTESSTTTTSATTITTTTLDNEAFVTEPKLKNDVTTDSLDDNGENHYDNDDDDEVNNNDVTTISATTTSVTTTVPTSTTPTESDVTNNYEEVTQDDVINDVTRINTVNQTINDTYAQVTTPSINVENSATPESLKNGTTETPEKTESERIAAEEGNPLPGTNINDLSQTVFMKLRVTNMNYTKNLTDRQSEEFKILETKFTQLLRPLLQSMDGFVGMEVVGFSYGSLVVNNELHFKDHAPENVKEDVRKRIEAAEGYFKYAHLAVDTNALDILKPNEANLCEFVQCQLYSDCVVRTSFKTECVCRPGYISVDPRNCVSLCDLEPGYCRNGGKCHIVPGRGAVCRCQVQYNWAYSGERCEDLLPKSVLLVSVSTGVACVMFMLLLAGSFYFFYRRRRNRKADKLAMEAEDKDFMRAAQVMSGHKRSGGPERLQRVNPMFVQEGSPTSDFKQISTSTGHTPSTSTSSLGHRSDGSTSTSSFFVREQLGHNGPIPGDMDTPERRMLNLQVGQYPNHRQTWCREDDDKNKKSKKDKRGERMKTPLRR
ncbi:uncharacterized protein LOC120334746 isoform X2 [Styela clava]